MDQSTQVNFNTIPKNRNAKMVRNNTSGELYLTHLNGISNSNSWSNIKPLSLRPKSLNITEAFNARPKYAYVTDASYLRLSQPGGLVDTSLGSISRERTPPFSCSSSLASTAGLGYKPPPYIPPRLKNQNHHIGDDESSTSTYSKCYCKCYDVEAGPNSRSYQLAKTPEALSWRRLHMSRAKLKATATTSELLSGFAMISMVELQINTPTNVPEWLFVMFAVCTTILVAVHIFALMISTYILPNIDAIAKLEVCEMVNESPHERMRGFIELAWVFSTILGLFLFLVEVAILCWVKFWDYSFTAAVAATVVVVPVLITFVLFAVHFYHSLVVFKCNTSINDMEKLEDMKKHLDEVIKTHPV